MVSAISPAQTIPQKFQSKSQIFNSPQQGQTIVVLKAQPQSDSSGSSIFTWIAHLGIVVALGAFLSSITSPLSRVFNSAVRHLENRKIWERAQRHYENLLSKITTSVSEPKALSLKEIDFTKPNDAANLLRAEEQNIRNISRDFMESMTNDEKAAQALKLFTLVQEHESSGKKEFKEFIQSSELFKELSQYIRGFDQQYLPEPLKGFQALLNKGNEFAGSFDRFANGYAHVLESKAHSLTAVQQEAK
jgi:hypothetical protein